MQSRRTTIGMLAVVACCVSSCGSSSKYANRPRPPLPVNVTVYINDARVSVSPSVVGAGPVRFIVANHASQAEALAILPAGDAGGQPLASTGPINPQGTTQVAVDFSTSGDYTVSAGGSGSTDASSANPGSIQPGVIHVGAQRSAGASTLLTP